MKNYKFTKWCLREYKKYCKKFRSLEEDIERFCRITLKLEEMEEEDFPGRNKNYVLLKVKKDVKIYKARLSCTSLRGNSFRVIYARRQNSIEIMFIELYTKGEKDREDVNRIQEYLQSV